MTDSMRKIEASCPHFLVADVISAGQYYRMREIAVRDSDRYLLVFAEDLGKLANNT